jgi:hypothetical protein
MNSSSRPGLSSITHAAAVAVAAVVAEINNSHNAAAVSHDTALAPTAARIFRPAANRQLPIFQPTANRQLPTANQQLPMANRPTSQAPSAKRQAPTAN